MTRPAVVRHAWTAGGLLFVGIGVVGAFLPLLPTVPFLLLALACFARGNPRLERWLIEHPRHGPLLRDWRERRAIPRRAKILAVGMMTISTAVLFLTRGPIAGGVTALICAASGAWIWTRNE